MIRLIDIVLSAAALLVLSPLLLAVMLVLRLSGEGEVFYCQQRVGKGGATFGLIKFVTMLRDSPNLGTGFITMRNDPRVLPVGRILRKTKINELPQIVNVLKGDLSLVGPRPQVPAHFDVYPDHVRKELVQVRPGLTGIGSIVFRDEESMLAESPLPPDVCYRDVIAPYKGELELWWLRRRSLLDYFRIIFLTAWVILFRNSTLYRTLLPGMPPMPAALCGDSETVPEVAAPPCR